MLEVLFGIAGLSALGRGTWLAFRKRPRASSWLAAGSAALPLLAFAFPTQIAPALVLIVAAGGGFSAAGTAFMLERLRKQERRTELAYADETQVKQLMDDASRSGDAP